MIKSKNSNVILAGIFSGITVLLSIFSLIYIATKYPVNFNGLSLFISGLSLFLAASFLISGIIFSKKALISISGILLCVYTFLTASGYFIRNMFSDIYFSYMSYGIGFKLFEFIIILLPAISFLSVSLYSFRVIKNKRFVLISLFISWFILLFTTSFYGISPEIFMVSSYILLLKYTNIKDVYQPVNMGEVFALSIATFGIYYILWCISALKKTAQFLNKNISFSECVLFILFAPYTAFWYYTRYEELNIAYPEIKNRGVLCLVLSLFFLSPLSLCILQRDFNLLAETLVPEDTDNEENISSAENSDEPPLENEDMLLDDNSTSVENFSTFSDSACVEE